MLKYYVTTHPELFGSDDNLTEKDADTAGTDSFFTALRQFEGLKESGSGAILFSIDGAGESREIVLFRRLTYTTDGDFPDQMDSSQTLHADMTETEREVYKTFYHYVGKESLVEKAIEYNFGERVSA